MKTSFFKIVAATLVALFLFWSFVFLSLIVNFAVSSKPKKVKIKDNSVLKITLNRPIIEHSTTDFDMDLFTLNKVKPLALDDILDAIKYAKQKPQIKGIYLELTEVLAGYPELYEIREALLDFKKSGKFIIAHADIYLQNSYYLATAADKIFLTPTGSFVWKGLSAQLLYYKKALDKLGIEPVVIRHGQYKSAVEPYMQDTISPQNQEQIQLVLDDFWNMILDTVSQRRGIAKEMLNLYADSLMITTDKKALEFHFVDNLKTASQVIDELKNMLGLKEDKKINFLTVDNLKSYFEENKISAKNKIAIVFAEGGINLLNNSGSFSSQSGITPEKYVKLFKKIRKDSSIKAVVFRINSPGGSALASEIIWQELTELKKTKPVVVSMGKYAASGGYYISAPADYIFAEPFTITGSIGVFGLFFNLKPLVSDKFGITPNIVKTNLSADALSFLRKPTATEIRFIRDQIEDIYQTFINHVADGRGLETSFVDSIGQGRIWTASQALKIHLIDEIGTLDKAVQKAANIANIANQEYEIVEYPKKKSFAEELSKMLGQEIQIMYNYFFESLNPYQNAIEKIKEIQGVQTRLPFDIDVE